MRNRFFEKSSILIILIVSILIVIMWFSLSIFNVELSNSIIDKNREDSYNLLSIKRDENIKSMNENIKFIANLISANSAELLYDMEQQMIFNTLKPFMKIKEIVAIEIYDNASNSVFASLWKNGGIHSNVKFPSELNLKEYIKYIADINYKNQTIGTLKVYYTDKYILDKLANLQENTLLKLQTFEYNVKEEVYKYNIYQILLLLLFLIIINFIAIKSIKLLRDKVELSKEEILKSNKKLENLNKNLEERVKVAVEENRKQEELLLRQSKMASLGEMLGSIAHQWRQPLNTLGLIIQRLEVEYFFGESINEKTIKDVVNDSMTQIEFMSKTIDDFRNFFKPNREKIKFSILESINDSINIISAQFAYYHIKIDIKGEDFNVMGYQNEFKQVILNILNNAKDAFINVNNPIKNIEIKIVTDSQKSIGYIYIKDNAKGLKGSLDERVFEPYFTTKHQAQGTGIGLYMSKMIIENSMGGKIYAKDISTENENGAEFIIELSILND